MLKVKVMNVKGKGKGKGKREDIIEDEGEVEG